MSDNPYNVYDPNGLNPAASCLAGAWGGPVGCGVGAGIGTAIAHSMAPKYKRGVTGYKTLKTDINASVVINVHEETN